MKKLSYLIVLALILGLVLTGCSLLSNIGQAPTTDQGGITYLTKHTEDAPFTTPLFAGQTIEVGTVSVWNDEENLYVTYETTGGWVMTETHLAVATTEGGIFQKNGNPVPGKFPYKHEDLGGVPSDSYIIPLNGWEVNVVLYIAAHAKVEHTKTGTFTPELTWQRSLEPDSTLFFLGYGANWTPTQAFLIPLDSNQIVWDSGLYYNLSVPAGREWASWQYAYTNPDGGSYDGYSDLRRFNATFTIPAGYTITSGSLYAPHFTDGIPINDNVYIFVNQNLLFWGGTRVNEIGGTFLGMAGIQALHGEFYVDEPMETGSWYISGTIPDITGFVPGNNAIDIFTEENERWGGLGKLMLELSYEYVDQTETAWAGTEIGEIPFDGKNWATYFNYTVQEQEMGPVVNEEYDSLAIKKAQVRYRNFRTGGSGWEFAVGTDVGAPGFMTDVDWTYSANWFFTPEYNEVEFVYDGTNKVTTKVKVNGTTYTDYAEYITGDLGDVDYMQWLVRGATGQTVEFYDVVLTVGANSYPLGDYSQTASSKTWSFSNFDLSGGFTLTGKINLTGQSSGQEQAKVDISIHALP